MHEQFEKHIADDAAVHAQMEQHLTLISSSLARIETTLGKQSGGFLAGVAFALAGIGTGAVFAVQWLFGK